MEVKIALAGNPNSGKTTMFNALTGSNQRVGNWPGVTVEKKEGTLKGSKDVIIQDLPGIYSLSPYTLEEVVARNYLVGEKPDAIINIVDGTNIERNLYLTTQLLELGIPTVVAVNMIDIVRKNGDAIDVKRLAAALGCEVMVTSALKGEGSVEVARRAAQLAAAHKPGSIPSVFEGSVEHAIAHIEESIEGKVDAGFLRWYAIKLFERDEKVAAELNLDAGLMKHIEQHIEDCEREMDDDSESIITNQRYAYIARVVGSAVKKKQKGLKMSASDHIDRVVTNRIAALPIFVVVMAAVYWIAMGPLGTFLTDWTNDVLVSEWAVEGARGLLEGNVADWLVGLVCDGIIAGVGAVIGFVPQMLILFVMLSILEDVGYMARIAFIMDRIFRKFGLSGKSFIPMLIGSGCGVPAVMASRTIENERDRRMTVMTTCFIPCSAKLPIISMIAGAFFDNAWWVATSAYFVGVISIVVSGIILKKLKAFAGEAAPFVMELPAYHAPAPGNVLRATWERGWSFIKRAFTVILLSSIIIWFLQGFGSENGVFGMVEDNNNSLLAAIGSAVAFIFVPLGFGTWQATVGVVGGLVAKENLVAIMGICYGYAELATDTGEEFWPILASEYTGIAAYSFMVFNLLCAPCFAAMGAIKREMNSPKWTLAAIGYMCGFAYCVSMMIYQIGGLITGDVSFGVWTVVAFVVLAAMIYLLVRKNRYGEYGERLTSDRKAAANA